MGPNSLMFIRNLLDKLGSNQQNILKFIACNEIFLMPATVFMLFRYNLFTWIFLWPVAHNIGILNQSEHIVLWFSFLQLWYEQYFSFITSTRFHHKWVMVCKSSWNLTLLNLISSINVFVHFIVLEIPHVFSFYSGQGSLLLPFIYYRFLTLRYTSRRNPYCR